MHLVKLEYTDIRTQYKKVIEEIKEIAIEIDKDELELNTLLEECWDGIQSILGIMFISLENKNENTEKLKKSYIRHIEKMQKRHNEGRIKIDEYIEY